MGLYAKLFPAMYGRVIEASDRAGLAKRRKKLLAEASGRTLELGAGTGANLPHYGEALTELVLSEPDEGMLARLDREVRRSGARAEISHASAERLPFPDDSFDTIVSTLVLCTVPDQRAALNEVERVLRPGGKLLFLEHVRSDDPRLARWQDRLNWLQRRIGCGCNCNRDTEQAITAAGLKIGRIEHDDFPKSYPIIRPLIEGSATNP